MEDYSNKPKRILGANLEHAEEFIADAVKSYTAEQVQELANHDSDTSNRLYQSYLSKYPNSMVNTRSLMLQESTFKHVAAEHAVGKRYFDKQ